jgi:hypothetical protein
MIGDEAIASLEPFVFVDGCRIILEYLQPRIKGTLVRTFSTPRMLLPSGTAVEGDILYVTDPGGPTLWAFDVRSGNVVFSIDCGELYGDFPERWAGPHEVFVTRDSIVLKGKTGFQFFAKKSGLHQKRVTFSGQSYHTVRGEFIYVMGYLAGAHNLVHMWNLDGTLVRLLPVVLATGEAYQHKEKTQLLFACGRFYLFEDNKLLMGPFSEKDSTSLVVEQVNNWKPAHLCHHVVSDEEMYCSVLDRQILCVTSTSEVTQSIPIPGIEKFYSQASYPSLSSQGLTVSDIGGVYLFQ